MSDDTSKWTKTYGKNTYEAEKDPFRSAKDAMMANCGITEAQAQARIDAMFGPLMVKSEEE